MVRSKQKSLSNKSSKNMHPSLFNNSRRNVNSNRHTADMNMQNYNMMPNAMTQTTSNIHRQNLNIVLGVPRNTAKMNKQSHSMMPNPMTQGTENFNEQSHSMMPNPMTQSTENFNEQSHSMMPNPMTQSTENFNEQSHSMMQNPITQSLQQWNSQMKMNDLLKNFVLGPNSNNSLFTSDHDLSPPSNFHPKFECNKIISNNGVHPSIDQSNFPLINEQMLSNNGPRDNIGSQYSNTVPIERPYGKHSLFKKYDHLFSFKVKKTSNSHANEFKMSNEDFPALPGTQVPMHDVTNTPSFVMDSNEQWSTINNGSQPLNNLNSDQFIYHNSSESRLDTDFHMNGRTVPKLSIQTSFSNGKVTNIPSSMLRDQFGIIGQLMNLKAAEYDPTLVELAHGQDLTSLGMNLNSPENIYPTFAGPFQNSPLAPHNIEFDVPSEYKIHDKIKNKLAPIKFSDYQEDLLFYLFYSYFGDGIQMAVASELRTRGWRYHTQLRLWITPVPESNMSEINGTFECGTYFYVFDVTLWRKVPRELIIDYTMLDGYVANATFIPPGTSTR